MKNRINNDYIFTDCIGSLFKLKSIRTRDATFMRKKRRQFHANTTHVKLMANKDTIYQPKIRNGIIAYVTHSKFHVHIIINIISMSIDLS